MKRREFLKYTAGLPLIALAPSVLGDIVTDGHAPESDFSKRLRPIGRALETEGYYVWCNSPIEGPDGRIHVFYSRWPASKGMGGWLNSCEIAHAVADTPDAPFEYVETILAPRGAPHWDGTTCHNPHIQLVDGRYCLFYMGNSNGKTNTKRVGLATAASLDGPWVRPDKPLLEAGAAGSWDDHCTTNPAFVKHPDGRYWLYYKSWNSDEYYNSPDPAIRGNRKYGLAVADSVDGPYTRYSGNPVIDFSARGGNRQFEDAFAWYDDGVFKLLARDMGVFDHEVGLYMESRDGISWTNPKIAYKSLKSYANEPPAPPHLKRYGRLERPQILFKDGKPAWLFTAAQGGKYMTSSAFILKIT